MILLVEDEALILLDVQSALEEAGFEVVSARNAEQALSRFNADPGRIKAVVTDIRLGSGLNGWDIGRQCRQANPAVPVIYMSGDSAAEWTAQGVPLSVMITKPFVNAQIITAISTLLTDAAHLSASNGG